MYGLIHNCVKQWVISTYGQERWSRILDISGVDEERTFLNFQCYPDEATMSFLRVVVRELGIAEDVGLEAVGEHFVDFTIEKGYGEMLHTLGRNFHAFLDNLDYLHCYLMNTAFPGIVMPSFACTECPDDPRVLFVDYYSRRRGLQALAVGAMKGCARRFYNLSVKFEVYQCSEELIGVDEIIHHVRFKVTQLGRLTLPSTATADTGSNTADPLPPDRRAVANDCPLKQLLPAATARQDCPFEQLMPASTAEPHVNFVSTATFSAIHPYHFIFGRELKILQYGFGVRLLCPDVVSFPDVGDLLELVWPYTTLSYANMERFKNLMFQFAVRRGTSCTTGTVLRGKILLLSDELVLFLGTPAVNSLQDLAERSLKLSDIPCTDAAREFILLKHQRSTEFDLMQRLEATTSELKRTGAALELEKEKTDRLLNSMLPAEVAHKLKLGLKVQESFDSATILFSDIVTFTTIASRCEPQQIVALLNEMYTKYDNATEHNKVYKVETIGDAYMVVGGVPCRVSDHSTRVISQAIDMVRLAREVSHPITGEPVQIRVGVHTGPTVAGVVGDKMPRYCLFGDSVNVASRMESHGSPGRIHISAQCKRKLDSEGAEFTTEPRGTIEIKGKGPMETYFVRLAEDPADFSDIYNTTVSSDTYNDPVCLSKIDILCETPQSAVRLRGGEGEPSVDPGQSAANLKADRGGSVWNSGEISGSSVVMLGGDREQQCIRSTSLSTGNEESTAKHSFSRSLSNKCQVQ